MRRRFRAVERAFLDTTAEHGYQEIRTPTIEPLHLFTATGALSPQLLDRVYSFLDWDGWSGERVVLRPDTTVPAARWYAERWQTPSEPARLCYVQPVYRFVPPADGDYLVRVASRESIVTFGPRAIYRLRVSPPRPRCSW